MTGAIPVGLSGRPVRVGLDVGGTKIDAVAVSPDGDILARLRRPTGWGEEAVSYTHLTLPTILLV